jgi:hypothetical protein
MLLTLNHIVKRTESTRSCKDRRFKVVSVIASYTGEDNFEYRKRFESKNEPVIPNSGTHEQINKLSQQF